MKKARRPKSPPHPWEHALTCPLPPDTSYSVLTELRDHILDFLRDIPQRLHARRRRRPGQRNPTRRRPPQNNQPHDCGSPPALMTRILFVALPEAEPRKRPNRTRRV